MVALRPTAGNRSHTAPAAISPHLPHAPCTVLSNNNVAEAVLSYTNRVAEARCQRIHIVLPGADKIFGTPRAGERGHGRIGVDDANTMIVVAADNDEVLIVFDDRSDAMRVVELCSERVSIVNVAVFSGASKSTHRPVAQNGTNSMIIVVAQQHVAFAVDAECQWGSRTWQLEGRRYPRTRRPFPPPASVLTVPL